MGTNYYLHEKPPCPTCGHETEPLHIGKSSVGWAFALRIMPERKIHDLMCWYDLARAPGAIIRNEYHEILTPNEFLTMVKMRRFKQRNSINSILWRDEFCDYFTGDFS